MSTIAVFLNHYKKTFDLVTDPYYQSIRIICGTIHRGGVEEEIAVNPQDCFTVDGVDSIESFYTMVRDSFHEPVLLTARSAYASVSFTMLNGVVTLHLDAESKYTVQYTFEKGIKLNEEIFTNYIAVTNSYLVRTKGSMLRKYRYESKQPKGESYDRVLNCLSSIGPLTTPEIATLLGIPENRVSGRISEMCKCGLIRKNGTTSVEGRTQTIWAINKKKSVKSAM